ncbi:MAG TPA: protein kinase, partial [Candidatus Xenobia bacterium]
MLTQGMILNDRYRIERVLGQGGMGAVYLATHLQLDEQVAVKEMLLRSGDDDETAEAAEAQFRSEARILNRLRHPNLPRVYDFFEMDERHYLVMDFIKGGTLESVQAKGPISEARMMTWARELCEVLQYLHNHSPSVIFRDLKPANIMLAEDGSLRLIDFGIAKFNDTDKGHATTKTCLRGAVSHGFAAPEQYGIGGTDARSDLYSMGATMYALLTGRVPPPSMEIASGISELVPIKEYRLDLSDSTVSAIEWMMQVRREMRPPSVAAITEALGLQETVNPTASLPAQMRRVLREEFHYFFPAKEWIDRGGVYANLLAHLHREPTPLISISGELGLGKSRLLQDIAEVMQDNCEVFPIAHGSAALRQAPFGLMLQMLGPWIRRRGAALASRLQATMEMQELHEAARVLPELTPLLQGEPAQRGPVERARSVMNALTAIFEEASATQPALLILDDMQWTDEATLRLLDTLRTGKLAGRIGLILGIDTGKDQNPCQEFIDRWTRKGDMKAIALPALQRQEIGPYIATLLPPIEGLERRLDTLLEKSHGNPLLLEELLRFMVTRRFITERNGMLAINEFRPDVLPSTLEEAIRRRREHLPIDCQSIISQAAVVGVRFELRTVLKLTGETTAALTEALQQACEAMFVQPDERGAYMFVSEAARKAFYDSLAPAQRTRLHHKLGTMEEERANRTGEVTQTAWHYEQAGDINKSLEFIARLSQDFLSPKTLEVVVSDALHIKMFHHVAELSPQQSEQAVLALNMFLRALKSMSVYGPKSPIFLTSFGTSLTVMTRLLRDTGPIAFAFTEDHFYVNNKTMPVAQTPVEFKSVLQKHFLSGFEFLPGLDERQCHEFLRLLIANHEAVESVGGWWPACQAHNITDIVVNETVFVGVAEKELFDASKLKSVEEVVVKNAADLARQQNDSIETMLATMSAAAGNNEVLYAQLKKLEQMLADLKKNPGTVQEARRTEQPLPNGKVTIEVDQEMSAHLTDLLRQARPDEVKRLVHLSRQVDVPLTTFLHTRPETLLQGLESADAEQRTLAAMGLLNMGREARRWLLGYLRQADHPMGRMAAVYLLNKMEADPSLTLAQELQKCTTHEECMRILAAMRAGDVHWTQALANALFSPVQEVRRGALQTLVQSNLPARAKLELMLPLLSSDNMAEVEDAVRFAGD